MGTIPNNQGEPAQFKYTYYIIDIQDTIYFFSLCLPKSLPH